MSSQDKLEQARRIADKYIVREARDEKADPQEHDEHYVQDVTTLLHFLISFSPERIRNGYTAKEAFDAACRLIGFEPEIMREHLKKDDF